MARKPGTRAGANSCCSTSFMRMAHSGPIAGFQARCWVAERAMLPLSISSSSRTELLQRSPDFPQLP